MQREPGATRAEHSQRGRQWTHLHSPAGPTGVKAPGEGRMLDQLPRARPAEYPNVPCAGPHQTQGVRRETEAGAGQLIRQSKQQLTGTGTERLTLTAGQLNNCPTAQRRKLRSVCLSEGSMHTQRLNLSQDGSNNLLIFLISNLPQVGVNGGPSEVLP